MDISDIPKIKGPLRYVGYLGVILMMGGLGVFAFGLLSMFANVDRQRIPTGFPPMAIYGFGVAAVGGILASLALGLGEKKERPINTGPHIYDPIGPVVIDPIGPVDARTYIINQQRTYTSNIYQAVQELPLNGGTKRNAEAAVRDVADAVERGDAWEIEDALGRLTNILNAAGAFAVAGNTAAPAIVALARTLGTAGRALLHWFGV
jgi:hypothetical protein